MEDELEPVNPYSPTTLSGDADAFHDTLTLSTRDLVSRVATAVSLSGALFGPALLLGILLLRVLTEGISGVPLGVDSIASFIAIMLAAFVLGLLLAGFPAIFVVPSVWFLFFRSNADRRSISGFAALSGASTGLLSGFGLATLFGMPFLLGIILPGVFGMVTTPLLSRFMLRGKYEKSLQPTD